MKTLSDLCQGKNIFIFSGGAGSGKTELALNFALQLFNSGNHPVTLVDLDVVKPYFRVRELKAQIQSLGLNLLMPPMEAAYLDVPTPPSALAGILGEPQQLSGAVVVDLGGDENGARVMAQYQDLPWRYRSLIFYVFNRFRFKHIRLEEIAREAAFLENSGSFKFSHLVHNSHLMWQTTPEVINSALPQLREIASRLKLEVAFHGVWNKLLPGRTWDFEEPVLPLELMVAKDLKPEH